MDPKQVTVVIPGSEISVHVPVTATTTAADALHAAGAQGDFAPQPANGNGYFRPEDGLDGQTENGQVLYASPWAKVGLEPTPQGIVAILFVFLLIAIPLAILIGGARRSHIARVRSGVAPYLEAAIATPPVWQRAGWRQTGDHQYEGEYLVPGHQASGMVFFRSPWDCAFWVLAPRRLIRACGRGRRCFSSRGRGPSRGQTWFGVHFEKRPESLSAGIIAIQQIITGAASQLGGARR